MKSFLKILFAPLLGLFQSCSPLGEPVNPEKSSSHYYNNDKTDIIYSTSGNWFELGKTPLNADLESFEVLSEIFGRDKNRIYYEAYPIEHPKIDLESFKARSEVYESRLGFDKSSVYTLEKTIEDGEYKVIATIIKDADPATFKKINMDWGKDAGHHFYRNKLLDVEYASFNRLNSYFSFDVNQAYAHFNAYFHTFKVDTDSFKVIEDTPYSYDKTNVYCLSIYINEKEILEVKTIPYNEGDKIKAYNSNYLRCGNKIYYSGFELEGAKADSFQVVADQYGKDSEHAFYENRIIPDADMASFHLSKERYGVFDKNGKYIKGKLVETESEEK